MKFKKNQFKIVNINGKFKLIAKGETYSHISKHSWNEASEAQSFLDKNDNFPVAIDNRGIGERLD